MNKEIGDFLLNYDSGELQIAAEFLSNWLPFLSPGLCETCTQTLSDRIQLLDSGESNHFSTPRIKEPDRLKDDQSNCSTRSFPIAYSSSSSKHAADVLSDHDSKESSSEFRSSASPSTQRLKKSWADIAREDEYAKLSNGNEAADCWFDAGNICVDGAGRNEDKKVELPREQRESIRLSNVKRKKDFTWFERVKGKSVNILEGLELHTGVFSAAEQIRIVKYVEQLQEAGKKGQLEERTYSAPNKWMRGKGRVTLQFGCCYNYATDKNGNPPGILKDETVDPLPQLFKVMVKRLVQWHVLPPSCVPDSCIVNVYEEGDCIPPHIDNHDFVRPFCTVSFLSECEILFGSNLKITGPGEFAGAFAIPLPVGSVLVLNGNGADVAKHCVPAVPTKRISITFRKMDRTKWPRDHVPEPDLQGLQPLPDGSNRKWGQNGSMTRHSRHPNSRS